MQFLLLQPLYEPIVPEGSGDGSDTGEFACCSRCPYGKETGKGYADKVSLRVSKSERLFGIDEDIPKEIREEILCLTLEVCLLD